MADSAVVDLTKTVDGLEPLPRLTRNPVVEIIDCRGEAPIRSWRQHQAFADDLARVRPTSNIFTVVQRRGASKGFWITEWTVAYRDGKKAAKRRRAAVSSTLGGAVEAYKKQLSFHNSHYFRPEEGLKGLLDR